VWNEWLPSLFAATTFEDRMTANFLRVMTAALLVVAVATAPAAQARDRHDRGGWRGGNRDHGRGNAAGAAIIGGLLGLGLGAAVASRGYAPPPAYYGASPGYYAPPPAVYYGY
jgi:hypothetical protein